MKLLTWMHRKFRQGENEIFKEFSPGKPLLENHPPYHKQNCGNGTLRQMYRDSHVRNSFASLEAARVEDIDAEPPAELSEFFHGFLAIGTLGTDTMISEPGTPTFAVSVDNIAEKETQVTETELKLINDELEKVLGAEAKEYGWTDSSGRNSQVSNDRSSHASTITLGWKPMDITESDGNGTTICPLQGYLFGSAVELPEKVTSTKKGHRPTLGELFQRQKEEENDGSREQGDREKDRDKDADRTATKLMQKILKKKFTHASSRSSQAADEGIPESASAEKKIHKILNKFHKKVHPEGSAVMQKLEKPHKIIAKNIITRCAGYNNGGEMQPDDSITMLPKRATRKRYMQHSMSQSNHAQFIAGGSNPNENRENWIKTDADYLVLEL